MNCRFPHKTINQDLNWNCRLPNSSCWSPLKLSIAKLKLLIITWTVDWYLKLLIITWTVHCYLEVLDHYLNCRFPHKTINQYLNWNCRLPNSSCWSPLKLLIAKFKLLIITWTVYCQIQVIDHHLNCPLLPRSSRSLLKLSIAKFKFSITS